MMYGPRPLPKFPTELISAIPAGAAAPARVREEIAQNGPSMHCVPAYATAKQTTRNAKPATCPAAMSDTAATNAGTATCQNLSLVLSECSPFRIIVAAPSKYGIVVTKPRARIPKFDACLNTVGSHKLIP